MEAAYGRIFRVAFGAFALSACMVLG